MLRTQHSKTINYFLLDWKTTEAQENPVKLIHLWNSPCVDIATWSLKKALDRFCQAERSEAVLIRPNGMFKESSRR
jgi:hypothetical protein